MKLVKNKMNVTKLVLTKEGVKALVAKALEDDPTYVLQALLMHESPEGMYINNIDVFVTEKGDMIIELEEIDH